MSDKAGGRLVVARLLTGAVASQALLSAANFAVGLLLLRNTRDAQYGYYVLASSAILLAVSIQNALFNPALAIRMGALDSTGRGDLVGGLYREQRRIVPIVALVATLVTLGLWYAGSLDDTTAPLVLVTIVATICVVHREYFRMVLFAHRRPFDILTVDSAYAVALVVGAYVAVRAAGPALTMILVLAVAAAGSGVALVYLLKRHEPWNLRGAPGILRDIAPIAAWSTAGAAVHWGFSQGYVYLVAAKLDVQAVAALAGTRLLIMPVVLLSTGIGSLMLPLASLWLRRLGGAGLWRRLCLCAVGLATGAICYFVVVWLLRDWIFSTIIKKDFAHRDEMMVLWAAVCLVMVFRDQLVYFLASTAQFRVLTTLTLASALISLAVSYEMMSRFGVVGALAGVLVGELVSVAGIIIISSRTAPAVLALP
jgi:O-antigen/teichoic acid export membrane protein